jgi:hypothetical protein
MYTISLDAAKIFECTLKLKGVSTKNSKVNLVIESSDMDIRCRGTINDNGKVNIPIKKLKGILDENVNGKLYLEVIAEDNYFIPFNSEYITEVSKKIDIVENITIKNTESPVQIVETSIKGLAPTMSMNSHAKRIIKNMSVNKVNIFKSEHKKLVVEYIKSYIEKNNISNSDYDILLKEIISCITE